VQAIETKTKRRQLSARPRINIQEDREDRESWSVKALLLYSDIVRLVGEEPEDRPCERWGHVSRCTRRPCDACWERTEWEDGILDIVREATDWGLYGSGHGVEGCPGRAFVDTPSVYRHRHHPRVVIVSWGGGLDI
jgi:hypothetical protein